METPTFLQFAVAGSSFGRGPLHPLYALAVQAGLITGGISGLVTIDDRAWGFVFFLVCVAVVGGWWIGVYDDWQSEVERIAAINANPSDHHPMLWDASPYVCIHGVKPHKETLQCAWPIAHSGIEPPTAEERKIRVEI